MGAAARHAGRRSPCHHLRPPLLPAVSRPVAKVAARAHRGSGGVDRGPWGTRRDRRLEHGRSDRDRPRPLSSTTRQRFGSPRAATSSEEAADTQDAACRCRRSDRRPPRSGPGGVVVSALGVDTVRRIHRSGPPRSGSTRSGCASNRRRAPGRHRGARNQVPTAGDDYVPRTLADRCRRDRRVRNSGAKSETVLAVAPRRASARSWPRDTARPARHRCRRATRPRPATVARESHRESGGSIEQRSGTAVEDSQDLRGEVGG